MRIRIGNLLLDGARGELSLDGRRLPIQPKALRLLEALAERADRVVTKSELLDLVWSDAAVTDGSLARAMTLARRALREDGQTDRIETIQGKGYLLHGPVELVVATASAGSLAEAPLCVGRDTERLRLRELVHPRTVIGGRLGVVRGVAGIGKTQLLRAVLDDARRAGVVCALGRSAAESDSGLHGAWRQIARRLAERKTSLSPDRPFADDPIGWLDEVCDRLSAAARRERVLLVFDDLHWADAGTLQLLRLLLTELEALPLVVLCAMRPTDASEPALLEAFLAEAARLDVAFETVELDPLTRDDTSRLVVTLAPASSVERHTETLWALTRGHPLFLRQSLLWLMEAEASTENGDAGRVPDLPAGIREAIEARLAGLSPAARATLEMSAIAGEPIDANLVARALATNEAEALSHFEEAELRFLIEPSDAAGSSWRFVHDLIPTFLTQAMGVAERGAAHAALATTLDRRVGATPLDTLARHYDGGLAKLPPERAIEVGLDAGDAGIAAGDLRAAETGYRLAVHAGDRLPQPRPKERARALVGWARAEYGRGRPACEAYVDEAISLAREIGATDVFADAVEWKVFSGLGGAVSIDPGRRMLLEEGHAGFWPTGRAAEARLAIATAWEFHWVPSTEERRRYARAAVSRARAAEAEPGLLARALLLERGAHRDPGHRSARAALIEEALRCSRGDPHFEVDVRRDQLEDLLFDAEPDPIDRAIDELGVRGALAVLRPEALSTIRRAEAARAIWQGDFEHGAKLTAQSRALCAGLPTSYEELSCRTQDYVRERFSATDDATHALMRTVVPLVPDVVILQAMLACLELDRGHRSEARRLLEAIEGDPARLSEDLTYPGSLALLAEAAADVGSDAFCRDLLDRLEPWQDHWLAIECVASFGSAARYRARLTHRLGDSDRARELLERALGVERRMGARPHEAVLRLDLARLAEAAPAALDRAAGHAHARAGLELARALCMPAIERALAELEARLS